MWLNRLQYGQMVLVAHNAKEFPHNLMQAKMEAMDKLCHLTDYKTKEQN